MGNVHATNRRMIDWNMHAANDALHIMVNVIEGVTKPEMIYGGSWSMEEARQLLA
jgi:hypothetical protein